MISGPSETGKTYAALYLLDQLARQYKKSQWAIVRKVHSDVHGTVVQMFRDNFVRDGVEVYGGEKAEWFDYTHNGARIWVGGMDRPGKVLSGARDGIYVNQAEELALPDWEVCTTRTTGRAGNVDFGGMTFGDCNPGPPTHWILARKTLKKFYSRHEDNPRLYTADGRLTPGGHRTMAVLDALTGVRKDRLRHGRWVSAEGAVYEFDPAMHEIDAFPVPDTWRRMRVIDFGFANPFVCQWWAMDNDDRAYLYREIYFTSRTVKVHAEHIKRLSGNERYELTLADHDAEDRATLAENGIQTIAAHKEITPGIQRVQERLAKAKDGKPRLFVMRGALVERDEALANSHAPVCTRDEFDVYMWPKAADGKPQKEVPVDKDNHGMDCVRYLCNHLDAKRMTDWSDVADLGNVEEYKSRWQ